MATEIHQTDEGKMRSFWERTAEHGTTVAEMVLDPSAAAVSEVEVVEVLSQLPDITGKDVLNLGAGIGRFTGRLAQRARSVIAVDFIPQFLQVSRCANPGVNITHVESDVAALSYDANSFDVVFSNGLLMYLTDEKVRDLFNKTLTWLRPGGHLFFQEPCFQLPEKGDVNPGICRRPDIYNSLFQSVSIPTEDGKEFYTFELDLSKSLQAYVKYGVSSRPICWLLEKVRLAESSFHGFKTLQEFLDNKQYSRTGILRYERIFGTNFVSTGGLQTTEEFVKLFDLQPGQHVLDVGSGIGGGAFYMAQKYDVKVTGIDLSSNMVSIALEKANVYNDSRVEFEVCDATKRKYPASSYDAIYSRDTILHIADKKSLFTSFLHWLKPGGKLLISDYSCRDGAWSEQFAEYVKQRGYILLSVEKYGQLLEEVGFARVKAMDRTEQFVEYSKQSFIESRA